MSAVCIHCGKFKRGIWAACKSCGKEPTESADLAQSVLLSDHNLLDEDLTSLAARFATGDGAKFRADDVERIARNIDATRAGRTWRPESIVVFVGILFLIAATMAVVIRSTAR
jgi:hypothetical protein